MGIIIICAIIGFIAALLDTLIDISRVNTGFSWLSLGLSFLGGAAGAVVGVCIYLTIGGAVGFYFPTTETVEEQEIFALNDSSSVEGTNYLFSGYINEELVYRYVINTERGKHIEEVDADEVYINEGDYTPTIKIYTTHFKEDWYYWFAYDAFSSKKRVEFFVPENTVTSEYNIDLQ